jgi:hypothetical protein
MFGGTRKLLAGVPGPGSFSKTLTLWPPLHSMYATESPPRPEVTLAAA